MVFLQKELIIYTIFNTIRIKVEPYGQRNYSGSSTRLALVRLVAANLVDISSFVKESWNY